MKQLKAISVIGHFGKGKTLLNGQTVKTKIVTDELCKQFGDVEVIKFDTAGGRSALLKAPFQCLSALKKTKNVIIFPAHNGLRVYAPLLSLFRIFFKGRKLHYVVIGGWLPEFLKKRQRLSKRLKTFDAIYVETNTMKRALEEQGFTNIVVMPNCKDLKILKREDLVYSSGEPYKLCTFSRVMKEKGIEDAVNAVKKVNEEAGRIVYTLDIYGQIDSGQAQWFEILQTTFPDYIKYGGLVDYDKSVDFLKNYFALLFPTYYSGEGFAGTILDAFASGVPVIASDWKYNTEIINSQVGFLYSTHNVQCLIDILQYVAKNSQNITNKKLNCLNEAHNYEIQKVVGILSEKIGIENGCFNLQNQEMAENVDREEHPTR